MGAASAGRIGGGGAGARLRGAVVLGALLLSLAAGCGGGDSEADERLRVVATYSILGDLVENVGGGSVVLTTLVGPNGDAHTFEPAPSDNAELARAGVVFQNGLGFEPWLGDLYESSGTGAERVVVTDGVEPLPVAAGGEPGGLDPHVWHDVENAIVMVETIRGALSGADPANAHVYEKNADEYISELEALDAGVREAVTSIPEENRVLFTSHDTFGYFAERYGFEVDTALVSASTEAGDPSAGQTARLVEEIEGSGVPAIFADNVSDAGVMERIASEAGVELAPPLYTDALGEPGSRGETYVEMVRYNVSTMSEALDR